MGPMLLIYILGYVVSVGFYPVDASILFSRWRFSGKIPVKILGFCHTEKDIPTLGCKNISTENIQMLWTLYTHLYLSYSFRFLEPSIPTPSSRILVFGCKGF